MSKRTRPRTGVEAKRRRARIARRLRHPGPPRSDFDVKLDEHGAIVMPRGSFDEPLKCSTCQGRRLAAVAAGHRRYAMCDSCIAEAGWDYFSERDSFIIRRRIVGRRTDFARWRPGGYVQLPRIHDDDLDGFRAIKAGIDEELCDVPIFRPLELQTRINIHLKPDEVLVSNVDIQGGSQAAIDDALEDARAYGFQVPRRDVLKAQEDLARGGYVRLRPRS